MDMFNNHILTEKYTLLEKHMIDTIKEWQMKIGYMPGNMKLYYPAESLKELLNLGTDCTELALWQELEVFCSETKDVFGEIIISCSENEQRYCLDVSSKGTKYIAEQIPVPEFLGAFLDVITTPGKTLADVQKCFRDFSERYKIRLYELDQREEGLGYTLYFEQNEKENYVYCVEEDAFGLTYHRFDHSDYQRMKTEGHHHD